LGQLLRTYRRAAMHVLVLTALISTVVMAQIKNPFNNPASNDSRTGGEPAAIARGLGVYKDRCAICHFSESDAKKIGPGLKAIYKRGKFPDGGKVSDASMEKWILSGGKDMPPFQQELNPNQIRDLIAYLKTL
jgi:mono/diheme cytochrome c family protein